jgi:hypothetical protein
LQLLLFDFQGLNHNSIRWPNASIMFLQIKRFVSRAAAHHASA